MGNFSLSWGFIPPVDVACLFFACAFTVFSLLRTWSILSDDAMNVMADIGSHPMKKREK